MADTAATTASGQPRLMPPQATEVTAAMEDTEDTAAMATGASVQPMLRLSPRPSLRPPLWPTPPLMPMLGATEDTTEATGADIGEATGEVTDITVKSNWMGKPQDRP